MLHPARMLLLVMALLGSTVLNVQNHAQDHAQDQVHRTWNLEFPTSESGAAQTHFLDGVTYMHLHMFEDAEAQFHAAQALAPDFAMAYWGEALNQHRTIWSIHRYDEARAVLAKLGATPQERAAKAPTEREKQYLGAVELLFGSGTQPEREAAYSAAMRELSEAHPEDLEATAWYALSLMRITPLGLTREQTRSLLAATSLRVLSRNPRHPGANRYLIQATDDPENTGLGIVAVENLAAIDTDAAEAIHIPSHYWLQHGMWQEVAESNWRAFASSMAWVAANGWSLPDLNQHNYGHLLQFANYGYLQSGNLAQAAAIRERVRADYIASGLAGEIEVPFADVNARYVLDLEQWQLAEPLAETALEYGITDAGLWQAIGVAAAKTGKLALAQQAVAILHSISSDPAAQGPVSAGAVDGLIQLAQGHNETALNLLREASELNWNQPTTLLGVPPRPVKPPVELYAEALLATGDASTALAQFQLGLTRYHGRTNLLLGAARAAEAMGNVELAQHYYQQLTQTWRTAAAEHPFAAEVRARFAN